MNHIAEAAHEPRPVIVPLKQQPRIVAGMLKPLIEHHPRSVPPSLFNPLGVEMHPYIVGHGQQLARKREAAKAEAVAAMYATTPNMQRRRH